MMLKFCFVLSSIFLSFATLAVAGEQYYQCSGYTMCACVPDKPGMSCDYYGSGTGSDQAGAASAAQADTKNNCEQECTRKTGNSCYGGTVYNCELVKK
jgi:hypothetical protein